MSETSDSKVRIDLEAGETYRRVAHITVEFAHMETVRDKVAKKLARKVRLDGFRPGKVPVGVVRTQMPGAVEQDALEALVPQVYKKVLDQNEDLHPIADPMVDKLEMPEGEPVSFDLVIEVRPDIEIVGLDAVDATRYLPPVDDARVDDALKNLAERHGSWDELESGGAAEDDAVLMDTCPLDDKGEPIEVEREEGQAVQVGGAGMLPEISAALIGMQNGEETEVEVNYPVDYPNEELRGSTRKIHLAVKEIRRKNVPALDDAFAKEHSKRETLAELREEVQNQLVTGIKKESDRQLREQLVDRLLTINDLPVPMSLEKRYLDAMLNDAVRQQGSPDQEISDEIREKFADAYRPVAQRAVKKMVLVDNLRRQHEIEASGADIEARITELAKEQGTEVDDLRSLIERAGNMDRLKGDLEEEMVFALLEKKATITVSEELPPAPEIVAEGQDEATAKE